MKPTPRSFEPVMEPQVLRSVQATLGTRLPKLFKHSLFLGWKSKTYKQKTSEVWAAALAIHPLSSVQQILAGIATTFRPFRLIPISLDIRNSTVHTYLKPKPP